jgi:membrane protein required for colicin V production
MSIDILLMILLIIAVFKGYRNGFIVAVFSFLGIIIGLIAAVKFSALMAGWLKESTSLNGAWLPFLSFALVMICVIILVRLGARMIQSAIELVLLGWVNKLSGMLLYAVLYVTVYSVFLFYAGKIHLIRPETFAASTSYSFIQPWGPKAVEWFGHVLPIFKGMFAELSAFFDRFPAKSG